jgi:hypothetical protein
MSDMLAVDVTWSLSDNRKNVRLQLPSLTLDGIPEPLRIQLSFDAEKVDEILQRLTMLRAKMLPAPTRN